MSVKRFASLTLLIGAALCLASADENPFQLLRKTLDMRAKSRVTMIREQPMAPGSDMMVKLKVEFDGTGKTRSTVLQPIRMANGFMIDDGRIMMTIMPEDKKAFIEESPGNRGLSTDQRMKLIARNYRLKFIKEDKIAGRTSAVVDCQPRHSDMPQRRIYIDRETYTPLRIEMTSEGTTTILADTEDFTVPSGVDAKRFLCTPPENYLVQKFTPAPSCATISEISRKIDFTPSVPGHWPKGFQMESLRLGSTDGSSMIVIRLTDGFYHMSVLQAGKFNYGDGPFTLGSSSVIIGDKTVTRFMSDLPKGPMNSFMEEMKKTDFLQ